jgi:hypothetical protein
VNYKHRKFIFIYFLLTIVPFFFSPAWAVKRNCDGLINKYHNLTDQLIQEIETVEFCARPAASFRDKVFSNLKYRANRLKTCIQMVKQGELGFDCSREFKKTVKADGGENCINKFEVMKNSFMSFEALFHDYQTCLESN